MDELSKEMKDRINDIPGDEEGWWKGGEKTFYECARILLRAGHPDDFIIDILTRMYFAVAAEFGF